MDKHWADIHKQLGQQYATSQKEIKESQAKMSNKLAEALKATGKAKLRRIQHTFLPKRDIDDFEHFIAMWTQIIGLTRPVGLWSV